MQDNDPRAGRLRAVILGDGLSVDEPERFLRFLERHLGKAES